MYETAKARSINLKGEIDICEACAYGKAQQKTVKKWTGSRSMTPFERIHVDISMIRSPSLGRDIGP